MFLGLPDPHPDPLVTSMDPDLDPSIIKQKYLNKLWLILFCETSLWLFILEERCKCTSVPDPYVFGPPGSATGSFSHSTDKRKRIRIGIRTIMSRIRNTTGYGYTRSYLAPSYCFCHFLELVVLKTIFPLKVQEVISFLWSRFIKPINYFQIVKNYH